MSDAPEIPPDRIWARRDLEQQRRVLIAYFKHRHLSPAEDYAQDVCMRMWKNLLRLFSRGPTEKERGYPFLMRLYEKYSSGRDLAGDQECAKDLQIYAYAIAANVLKEQWNTPRMETLPEEFVGPDRAAREWCARDENAVHKTIFPGEANDVAEQCLHDCFRSLPKETDLLLKYYETDKKKDSRSRQRLADELRVARSTLHVTAHRAREKVRDWVIACMERELPGSSRVWCEE
jgi:DNA-directed RNA polymerase specialized sigma24 family protein